MTTGLGPAHTDPMAPEELAPIPRTLSHFTETGERRTLDEAVLAEEGGCVVILGEPGLGKTTLLETLGSRHGWVMRRAAQFAIDPDPGRLAGEAGVILIDALDEMSAVNESDPLDSVLAKLVEGTLPRCFIACRSAEWQGAAYRRTIEQEYSGRLTVLKLHRFDRQDALVYLNRLSVAEADAILDQLDRTHAEEIYGNPLTLQLLADACRVSGKVPETRAALFRAACEVMWEERGVDPGRRRSPLASLDEGTALDCAGAICAALILAGAGAVSRGPGPSGTSILRISEITALPGAAKAEAVLSSRLFVQDQSAEEAVRPIHKMVAEYLGARWLASRATTPLLRQQILALLQVDGGVPASLRGIHAWLAHHHPDLAGLVIDADPYGLLRYGDADGLDVPDTRRLIAALERLQEEDPYFRSEDWGSSAGRALGHAALASDIRRILLMPDGVHLRSLILNSLAGTPVSALLAPELEVVVRDAEERYVLEERRSAAEALMESEASQPDWTALTRDLVEQATEDSTRLAIDIIRRRRFEGFPAADVAAAALSHVGLLKGSQPSGQRSTVGTLTVLAYDIPDTHLAPVLDAVFQLRSDGVANDEADWLALGRLARFVLNLIDRAVEVAVPDAPTLLRWLSIVPGQHGHSDDARKALDALLNENTELRRDIQRLAFLENSADPGYDWPYYRLTTNYPALAFTDDDVIAHLKVLASRLPLDARDEASWRHLSGSAYSREGAREKILAAAELSVENEEERAAHIHSLRHPVRPEWEVRQEARQAARAAEKAREHAERVANYAEHINDMRQGGWQSLRWPAQAYFKSIPTGSIHLKGTGGAGSLDRIGEWLNPELQAAASEGFERILHRDDNPSAQQLAESLAERRYWPAMYPITAGVAERVRDGRSLDDLSADVVAVAYLTLHEECISDDALKHAVKEFLRQRPELYEQVWRWNIEPQLRTKRAHLFGLRELATDPEDRALSERLATEWLTCFPRLPAGPEAELVDIVLRGQGRVQLELLWRKRLATKSLPAERRKLWQAIGLITEFEAALPYISEPTRQNRDLLWHIQQRAGLNRFSHQQKLPLPMALAGWMISRFRRVWPYVERPTGVTSGDRNPWDATRLLIDLIDDLAASSDLVVREELWRLAVEPADDYTPHIQHAAAQQMTLWRSERQKRVSPGRLKGVLTGAPPQTIPDLVPVMVHALDEVQARLRGSQTDPVDTFWDDDGRPRDEDRCTDRLIDLLEPHIRPYAITLQTQADMPQGKRADFACAISADVSLPVEAKGQWNRELWQSAEEQLNAFYAVNHASGGQGIYLVYWFGACERPLKPPPGGGARPQTPGELESALRAMLQPALRDTITIYILDCTRPSQD
ncbi:NACHT domain-containing protein [Glycocaulis sp.]